MSWQPFWERKALHEMSTEEWESLCDGCGKCCLHKLEDDETGEVHYTNIACRYLDDRDCHCQAYSDRQKLVPECLVLKPDDVQDFHWLPDTCAYRVLASGNPLAAWHPLISGDPNSVHRAGVSAAGRTLSEVELPEEDWQDQIVHWV